MTVCTAGWERNVQSSFVYLRPTQLVGYRSVGPYEQSASSAWQLMFDWLDANGLRGIVDRGYGLAHDDPRVTPAEHCRYDACIEIPNAPQESWQQMMPQRLPGGAYHRHRHVGPHSTIGSEIRRIRESWNAPNGLVVAVGRPLVEIYMDDPKFCEPENLRTDLCLPVAFARESV